MRGYLIVSKKLIDERAILLFPSLAKQIGLNNAIFIQQLHFWCDIADELGYGKLHNGERWVYKTAQEWKEKDFPFWSVVTIRRIINSLHDQGLIHAMYLDDDKWNRTLFYRINYSHCALASDQIDNMEVIKQITSKSSKRSNGSDQNDEMLSENTTKSTSEITTDIINKGKPKFNPKHVELPVNVDKDIWFAFVDMRNVIKKPMSERAVKIILNKLSGFGFNANACLDQSIVNNWQDVYDLKVQRQQYQTAAQRTALEHDKWRMAEQQTFGEKDVTPVNQFLIGE